MIDPTKLTDENWTEDSLQEFWIFSICVAGKNADRTAKLVSELLTDKRELLPFTYVGQLVDNGLLAQKLRKLRFGQYNRIERALTESISLAPRLDSCTVDELETIFGVGMKTSRFFLMYSRKDVRIAALDTHILKFLRDKGYDAPKSTPSGKKYLELEKAFLVEADKIGVPIPDLDLYLWKLYSNREV